jgi:hypothetical protein
MEKAVIAHRLFFDLVLPALRNRREYFLTVFRSSLLFRQCSLTT